MQMDVAKVQKKQNNNGIVAKNKTLGRKLQWVLNQLASVETVPAVIHLQNGNKFYLGDQTSNPVFEIELKNDKAVSAITSLDELKLSEAYIKGDIEITGDFVRALDLRGAISDSHPILDFIRRIKPTFLGQIKDDRSAIQEHYEFDDDFYMLILDKSRTYSQAVYESDDESLEVAMKRKLDYVIESCHLTGGARVLDVGGGWGAFSEYAGNRGIEVTSLTIADHSKEYISKLIKDKNLPCRMLKKNFLEYSTNDKYDAVVVLGVIEHMPYYDKVVQQLENTLKVGGYAYFDGSASTYKYDFNAFINRYIFPGNHCMMSIHDFLGEVQKSDMELLTIHSDRCERTIKIRGSFTFIKCRWRTLAGCGAPSLHWRVIFS